MLETIFITPFHKLQFSLSGQFGSDLSQCAWVALTSVTTAAKGSQTTALIPKATLAPPKVNVPYCLDCSLPSPCYSIRLSRHDNEQEIQKFTGDDGNHHILELSSSLPTSGLGFKNLRSAKVLMTLNSSLYIYV